MISKSDLEFHINNLLIDLDCLQNSDGSFDTFVSFPSFPKDSKWRHWNKVNNPPGDTAFTVFPLLNIRADFSENILIKVEKFLVKRNLSMKLWKYSDKPDLKLKMPYDMDSTAYCSYLLTQRNKEIDNKNFINSFINKNNYYSEYLFTENKIDLTFRDRIKLRITNSKATIFKKSNQMALIDDWETGITCNVLLYLGKFDGNSQVWSKLKEDFKNMQIETNYYSLYYSIYAYARLICYGNHDDMKPSQEKLNLIINQLYVQLDYENESLDFLFLANTILFFNLDIHDYSTLIKYSFKKLEEKKHTDIAIYYSGNSKISTPETNAYFGSPGMTCSLYLEFLNLYRKRIFGSYYGF